MTINLATRANDNKFSTPQSMLEDALQDIKSGKETAKKAIVLFLDDENGYDVGFYAAKMKASEMLALMARFSHIINRDFIG